MKQNYYVIYMLGILGISTLFSMQNPPEIKKLYEEAKKLELENKVAEAVLAYGELSRMQYFPKDYTPEEDVMLNEATKKFNEGAPNALKKFEKEKKYVEAIELCELLPSYVSPWVMVDNFKKLMNEQKK